MTAAPSSNHLAATFDQTLATLAQLRQSRCVLSHAEEGEPFDLRDLAELAVSVARAVDRLINSIAERGGVEGYESELFCVIDGNLEFQLNEKASTIDMDRIRFRSLRARILAEG